MKELVEPELDEYRNVIKDLSSVTFDDMDGNARTISVDGVVRHEIGQALNSITNWKTDACQKVFNREYWPFLAKVRKDIERLEDLTGKQEGLLCSPLQRLGVKHGYDHAWDQVMTDLYAIEHGGSAFSEEYNDYLKKHFTALLDHMKKNNWNLE